VRKRKKNVIPWEDEGKVVNKKSKNRKEWE